MKNTLVYLFSLSFILIIIFVAQFCFQNITSQTLDQYEFRASNLENNIPSIKVEKNPIDIAVNENTNKVYVTNFDSRTVSIIDSVNMITKNVQVGKYPSHITIDRFTEDVYITHQEDDIISVIDGLNDTKIDELNVGGENKIYHSIYDAL